MKSIFNILFILFGSQVFNVFSLVPPVSPVTFSRPGDNINHLRRYPISKYDRQWYLNNLNNNKNSSKYENIKRIDDNINHLRRYPISKYNRQWYLNNLNNDKNSSIYENIKRNDDNEINNDEFIDNFIKNNFNSTNNENQNKKHNIPLPGNIRIIMNKEAILRLSNQFQQNFENSQNEGDGDGEGDDEEPRDPRFYGNPYNQRSSAKKRSKNFEVITDNDINFNDVGGYDNIKNELYQCVDILSNYTKYAPYNVRVPKGLILEGPPGNGKTLIAKALAGEANCSFIAVSGSEFQEKYVGVGSSRIRELFKLAKENIPCIVFIDEIDALGRQRSSDGDTSGNERDSTLNELLVALDGFKNTSGVFVIGATNRADLLDSALIRPGRIDKRIFIGNPDKNTRHAILNIHSRGKPADSSVVFDDIIELTNGLSGAQIENLVNEAMLNALRNDKKKYSIEDLEEILNKMMVGWQPNEHQYTTALIDQIAIHELGHAVVGLLSKHHAKMTKVVINLSSPKNPAYTIFENSNNNILTREALFEHLMILLAGRIAEEVVYGVSVSTGAINDFEEALKLSQHMVCYYGMGKKLIYPSMSEKYKEMIDTEVSTLISDAYGYSEFIIRNSKDLIMEGAEILKNDKVLKSETLLQLMNDKYKSVLSLKL
jgi:cell division protease FtsH